MDVGNVPGYPLGYGRYGLSIEPVRVVGDAGEGGDDDSGSDGGMLCTADEGGRGVPLMAVSRRSSWVRSELWLLNLGQGDNSIMGRCVIKF